MRFNEGDSNHQAATSIVAASDSLHSGRADYVCDASNFETQIAAAISSGNRKIFMMEGNYVKSTATAVSLYSNTEIELSAGATITFANGIDADACIFTNADQINGNTNIIIRGGRLCGNDANQSAGIQWGVDFKYVDGIVDTRIEEFRNGDVRFVGCEIDYTNRNYEKAEITISDCESLTGWTGPYGGTADLSSDRRVGSNSFHFTTTNASPCYIQVTKTWAEPIDMRFMDLSFWLKFNVVGLADTSCKILLYASPAHDDNDRVTFSTMKFEQEMADDKWYHIRQSIAGGTIMSGGVWVDSYESLSHVYGVRITFINGTTGVLQAWVDDIKMIPALMEPLFNLSFDNIDSTMRDTIAPALEKRGYIGSIHPEELSSTVIDVADVLYKKYGWEVCPHINMQSGVPDSTFYNQVVNLKSKMEDYGFTRGARFCSFEGHYQRGARTEQIRRVYSGWRSTSSDFISAYFDSPAKYKDIRYDFNTVVKPLIDDAIKYHSTLYLMGHYISDGSGVSITEAELNTVLDYLHDDIGAKVVSFNEIFNTEESIKDEHPRSKPASGTMDIFMDTLVASTTAIHAAIIGTGAELEVTTAITNPDVVRNSSITTTNVTSPSGNVTITGVDAKGNSTTEDIAISAGSTAYGSKAFATVSKITIPAGVTADDTVAIGISDKLGLSNIIYASCDVYKVKKNNADTAIGTVNTTYDTVDCANITGGDDFTIWYKSNLNSIS